VLGVAVASPLAFGWLPWLLAVLVVFLVGIAVELGPGLLLEALTNRAEAAAVRRAKKQEEAAGDEPLVTASPPSFSSLRQRRVRPRALDGEDDGGLSPTAAGGANSGGGGSSQANTPTARGALVPIRRRHASLRGARVDVKAWRVVEGSFAAYKVEIEPGGGQDKDKDGGSWTVWRRCVRRCLGGVGLIGLT
jgi:hypothetical protein